MGPDKTSDQLNVSKRSEGHTTAAIPASCLDLKGGPQRKQMTPRATSFTFHQRSYRNGSVVCKARVILPLGTFSISINFSFSRNYWCNVDKESLRLAIFSFRPIYYLRIQFSLKEGGLMAGSSIIYKWCLVQ